MKLNLVLVNSMHFHLTVLVDIGRFSRMSTNAIYLQILKIKMQNLYLHWSSNIV